MSEIDWSKAPEGFPLWLEFKTVEHRVHSGWYRKEGNYFKGYYGAHWPEYRTGQFFNVHYKSEKHLINDAYLPPIRPSTAWNGENLPPVGTVCLHKNNGLEKMRVFAIDGKWAAVSSEFSKFWCPVNELIPIRTPEQIAAAEQNKAVAEMMTHVVHATPIDCELLYRAGYRKQEQPK